MTYDKTKFKVWALPHPVILHYVLNPGLMFNELILGQRLPKVRLIDKKSDKPLLERTYIPCPHCDTLNDARLWSKGNTFGHWFGYLCPNCNQTIPCLWNIFSLVILTITFPIWYLFARSFRNKWLIVEKTRLSKIQERPLRQAKSINWILRGTFLFGGFMWFILEMLPQLWSILNGNPWDLTSLITQLFHWFIIGFIWGVIMHVWMHKKGNP